MYFHASWKKKECFLECLIPGFQEKYIFISQQWNTYQIECLIPKQPVNALIPQELWGKANEVPSVPGKVCIEEAEPMDASKGTNPYTHSEIILQIFRTMSKQNSSPNFQIKMFHTEIKMKDRNSLLYASEKNSITFESYGARMDACLELVLIGDRLPNTLLFACHLLLWGNFPWRKREELDAILLVHPHCSPGYCSPELAFPSNQLLSHLENHRVGRPLVAVLLGFLNLRSQKGGGSSLQNHLIYFHSVCGWLISDFENFVIWPIHNVYNPKINMWVPHPSSCSSLRCVIPICHFWARSRCWLWKSLCDGPAFHTIPWTQLERNPTYAQRLLSCSCLSSLKNLALGWIETWFLGLLQI